MGFSDRLRPSKIKQSIREGEDNIVEVVEHVDDKKASPFDRAKFDIARAIAPESAEVRENYFKVGGDYCRTLYVHHWPQSVDGDGLKELLRFHNAIDFTLYVQPLPIKPFMAELTKHINRDLAVLEKNKEDGRQVDPVIAQRLESNNDLRQMIGQDKTKPFQIMCMITIRAKTEAELDSATNQLEANLMSINTQRATYRHKEGFNSTLPIMENQLADMQAVHYFHTHAVMNLFPFSNSDITHEAGVLVGVNQATNTPLILNRFLTSEIEAPNTVIIGGTGSGKSFFAKIEQIRWAYHGIPIVTLDPSGEFVDLAKMLGGVNIDISMDSGDHINPLDFSYAVSPTHNALRDKLSFLVELLRVMMRTGGDDTSMVIDAMTKKIFENALIEAYYAYGYEVGDLSTQQAATPGHMPKLSEAVDMLKRIGKGNKDPEVQRRVTPLVAALDRFVGDGSLAPLFDNRSTVEIKNSPYINFNYHNLSQDYLPMAMHLVLEFFRTALFTDEQRESGIHRLLYVDEAQVLMAFPETAHFLQYTARTCRKFGIGLTVITQNVGVFVMDDDKAPNKVGRAILANCPIKVLLKQEPSEAIAISEAFRLNENELTRLLSSSTGEGLIIVNRESCWFSSVGMASNTEFRMCTTDTTQRAAFAAEDRLLEADNEDPSSAFRELI